MALALVLHKPSQLRPTPLRTDVVPRDRYDRPLIGTPGTARLAPYTRCTTFVDCIEDKSTLASWGKRMVVVGAARAPHLMAPVRTLDPGDRRDKQALNRIAESLINVAGANTKRERGTHLHALSEYVDRGEALPACTDEDLADMAAYKSATVALDVAHIERLVVVDDLKIAGTPDRISHYDGPGPDGRRLTGNLITDLKTGSVDYGALKMAMQLAVYAHGMFYDHTTKARTPLPDVRQDWGLIVHLPAGAGECTVYWVDLTAGWDAVHVAAQVRSLRRTRNLLVPLRSDVSPDTPLEVADLDPQA